MNSSSTSTASAEGATDKELDLLWGAAAIAAALGRTRRATYHLLESGDLPARQVGRRWVVSRTALVQHFEGGRA